MSRTASRRSAWPYHNDESNLQDRVEREAMDPSWPARPMRVDAVALMRVAEADLANVTVGRLAKRFNCSREHLSRVFRTQTGQTLSRAITGLRSKKAVFLVNAGVKIEAAVRLVGWKSKSSYYRHLI